MPIRPLKLKSSYSVGYSPSGENVFTLSRDISLWDIASRKKSWRTHPFPHPSYATFSPNGDLIGVKSSSGQIVILATKTGQTIQDFKNAQEGEGSNLLFSTCGRFIVDGSWEGFLTVRDAFSGIVRYRKENKGVMVSRVHAARDASLWVVQYSPRATTHDRSPLGDYFTVQAASVPDGASTPLGIRLPFITASAVSNDGSRLAVLFGASPKTLQVYELPSEKLLWQDCVTIGGSGWALCWSGAAAYLASVQKDCVVHYSGETGKRLMEFPLQFPSDVDYSPDGQTIALGSWQSGEIVPLSNPIIGEPSS